MTSALLAPADDAAPDGPRRSLVLAGGGMRVAYQAGVLAALEQAGLRFHHVDGASGGTMNLSMLLGGQDAEEACQRWRALRQRDFAALLPWRDYARSPRWPALGSGRGLREKVFPQLGIDPEVIRQATGVVGTYNVGNFATKTAQVVEHPDIDLDLLVAAVSLPVLMPAVVRDGTPYTDAAWIRDSNVLEAVARGSDEVWLVWCIGNTPAYQGGLFRQYVHMLEMAATGSLLRDLDYIAGRWPERPVRLHVIKPRYPLPLDPAYYWGHIDGATLIGLGYQDACRYLDNPDPLSAPWDPGVTQMREPPPGAAARVVLAGQLTDGTSGPIQLHLQLQVRGQDVAGVPRELSVAGDLTAPGLRPHTLIEHGVAVLDPAAGLTLCLRWRGEAGPQSLLAVPAGHGRALAVSIQDDRDGQVTGTGSVPVTGWRLARALASVHATDSTSAPQAARSGAGLAVELLRAARRGSARPAREPAMARPSDLRVVQED